jgi:hypothetical protein
MYILCDLLVYPPLNHTSLPPPSKIMFFPVVKNFTFPFSYHLSSFSALFFQSSRVSPSPRRRERILFTSMLYFLYYYFLPVLFELPDLFSCRNFLEISSFQIISVKRFQSLVNKNCGRGRPESPDTGLLDISTCR